MSPKTFQVKPKFSQQDVLFANFLREREIVTSGKPQSTMFWIDKMALPAETSLALLYHIENLDKVLKKTKRGVFKFWIILETRNQIFTNNIFVEHREGFGIVSD